MTALIEAIKKAGTTDTEKVIDALAGLTISTPVGPVTFRADDHQSTLGAGIGISRYDAARSPARLGVRRGREAPADEDVAGSLEVAPG